MASCPTKLWELFPASYLCSMGSYGPGGARWHLALQNCGSCFQLHTCVRWAAMVQVGQDGILPYKTVGAVSSFILVFDGQLWSRWGKMASCPTKLWELFPASYLCSMGSYGPGGARWHLALQNCGSCFQLHTCVRWAAMVQVGQDGILPYKTVGAVSSFILVFDGQLWYNSLVGDHTLMT